MHAGASRCARVATSFLLATLASGCPSAFSLRCYQDRDCPAGAACQEGICVSTLADAHHDAAVASDSGATDIPPNDRGPANCARTTAGPCGNVSVFRDDFADGLSRPLWRDGIPAGCTLVEQAGGLRLTCSAVDSTWITRASWFSADLTEDWIAVKVDWHLLTTAVGGYFEFVRPVGSTVGIAYHSGAIHAYTWNNGTVEHGTIDDPDPVQDAWWRIRDHGGDIAFETSADGCAWISFAQIARPADWDRALGFVWLAAGGEWSGNQSFEIDFRSLNTDRPTGDWCPAGSLQDDFGSGPLDPRWLVESPGNPCQISATGDVLQIDATLATNQWCMLVTRQAYQLDDVIAKIDLLSSAGAPAVLAGLALWTPPHSYAFGRVGDELWVLQNDVRRQRAAYQGQSHLRIARAGSALEFQTSTDGTNWTPFWTATPPASFVAVELGVGVADVGLTAQTAVSFSFDNFNL